MQAARGASLTPEGGAEQPVSSETHDAPGSRPRPARARVLAVFVGTAVLLYAADQLSKAWAIAHLTGQPSRPLLGEVLQLHLVRNPGAAFSTGTGYTGVFTVIATIAVLVVLWLARRVGSLVWAAALGVLLAGVAGNLTDRVIREPALFRGHVIDFLVLPNWPVFNVADVAINVAALVILVQAFRGVRLDGRRVAPRAARESEAGGSKAAGAGDASGGDGGGGERS